MCKRKRSGRSPGRSTSNGISDASPSDWRGDPWRQDFLRLSLTAPDAERQADYSAEIPVENRKVMPIAPPSAVSAWTTGICFISEPVAEDMVFAGYSKARLWVSSTSDDMDIYVTLRIIDEMDREVDYIGTATMGMPTMHYPLAKGWLKVSHRKQDASRSTVYTVKHTHLAADHALLKKDEVVPVEVEIIPSTARIPKGHRIRVDVQPFDGYGHGTRHAYDPGYHDGARNVVYTGPNHLSYIQLPVVPERTRPKTGASGAR